MTYEYGGIDENDYYKYYNNKQYAVAYKLGEPALYSVPKDLSDFNVDYVPQSYIYVD